MKIVLLVALSLCVVNGFAQSTVLFRETFDNNQKGWCERNDSNFRVNVQQGVLHIEKLEKNRIRNGCLWYNKEIPGLNTMSDFSITFFAKTLSWGDIFNSIDFQWGKKNGRIGKASGDSLYQVGFMMNGQVHLSLFNKNWTYLYRQNIGMRPADNVFNKYEIQQQGDTCIILINDVEVFRKPIKRIYGNTIGIQQCMKGAWEIDEIIIKQERPVL